MAELTTLTIKAERLGTIQEVTGLLSSIENAYNGIYTFDFIVETLSSDHNRIRNDLEERLHYIRRYAKEFAFRKDYPYDPIFYEMFLNDFYTRQGATLPNLNELLANIEVDKIILPSERLKVTKVNIQSPGFWQFLGGLNPLQQIREYLKDCHERKKDKEYRNRQEREKGDLDIMEKQNNIIKQRVDLLKSIGYSDTEIRPLIATLINEPLKKLGNQQDIGMIEYPQDNGEQ